MKIDRFFCGSGFCSISMLGDFAQHVTNSLSSFFAREGAKCFFYLMFSIQEFSFVRFGADYFVSSLRSVTNSLFTSLLAKAQRRKGCSVLPRICRIIKGFFRWWKSGVTD